MHRQWLIDKVSDYLTIYPENSVAQNLLEFVQQNPNCFDRSNLIGHITGSAWVVSADSQRIVLIHHKKLNKWMQPGGHSDGNPHTATVALREATEETGLNNLKLASEDIFDLDIHQIPERVGEPAHDHFDVRFVVRAGTNETLHINDEVSDLRWFDLKEILAMNLEESVLRMARKWKERGFYDFK